ncbi:MAG: hypothetical protein HY826_15375 [Actinobacteria bacterium]|nr:hypothetical protein [Actinomycetota bacterium]
MADTRKSYTLKIVRDQDESLFVQVVQLPGCFASGRNFEELGEALAEAMSLYLSTSDVAVNVKLGDVERVLRLFDSADGAEIPAEIDFALAQ